MSFYTYSTPQSLQVSDEALQHKLDKVNHMTGSNFTQEDGLKLASTLLSKNNYEVGNQYLALCAAYGETETSLLKDEIKELIA